MPSLSGPRFPLVQLASHHDVQKFSSGDHPGAQEIDEYLRSSALAEQAAGLSSVWIAIDAESSDTGGNFAGYFTLSPLSVQITPAVLEQLGLQSVPYRTVGGYLLGRLGVASRLQGQQLGSALVAAAIKVARQARNEAGGVFLAVDPKNDKLLAWYERLDFGFRRLDPTNATKRRLILRL
ncbi:MAG: GNAT family N-acetyltransferase [Gemmatimonadaceae bacterium]